MSLIIGSKLYYIAYHHNEDNQVDRSSIYQHGIESNYREEAAGATVRQALVRTAFGIFLSALATIISDPYWYTIRGDCEFGLCLMSMLTPEEYAALLLTGGFVRVVKKDNSASGLGIKSLSVWDEFFENVGIKDVAEATDIRVKVGAFKHRKAGTKIGEERMDLKVLRLGRCEEGESIDACLQLADGIDPPPTSAKLRSAQRALHRRIKHLIHPILHLKEDEVRQQLEAVVEWVRMKASTMVDS